MDLSAFQLFKHNARTNSIARLHRTPIVDYGRIIKVLDIQTVVVETVVQTTDAKETYTVTLLNLSSALLEINAYPKLGDTVLLLFLRKHDPFMFIKESVINPNATGYNYFSGVGVLMSTVKGFADTVIRTYEDGDKSVMDINSSTSWRSTFNSDTAITFCRAVMDSEDEALINILFGEGRPLMAKFLSKVNIEMGENAPLTISSESGKTEKYAKAVQLESEDAIDIKASEASISVDSAVEIKNTSESLGGLLGEIIDMIDTAIKTTTYNSPTGTTGGPCTLVFTAGPGLSALKNRLQGLIK